MGATPKLYVCLLMLTGFLDEVSLSFLLFSLPLSLDCNYRGVRRPVSLEVSSPHSFGPELY